MQHRHWGPVLLIDGTFATNNEARGTRPHMAWLAKETMEWLDWEIMSFTLAPRFCAKRLPPLQFPGQPGKSLKKWGWSAVGSHRFICVQVPWCLQSWHWVAGFTLAKSSGGWWRLIWGLTVCYICCMQGMFYWCKKTKIAVDVYWIVNCLFYLADTYSSMVQGHNLRAYRKDCNNYNSNAEGDFLCTL